MPAVGVEMQPVIMFAPARADAVGLLENERLASGAPQRYGAGKASRSGADDESLGRGGHLRGSPEQSCWSGKFVGGDCPWVHHDPVGPGGSLRTEGRRAELARPRLKGTRG